jgi:hypothetical protein
VEKDGGIGMKSNKQVFNVLSKVLFESRCGFGDV